LVDKTVEIVVCKSQNTILFGSFREFFADLGFQVRVQVFLSCFMILVAQLNIMHMIEKSLHRH
jgi:hypothetical protein